MSLVSSLIAHSLNSPHPLPRDVQAVAAAFGVPEKADALPISHLELVGPEPDGRPGLEHLHGRTDTLVANCWAIQLAGDGTSVRLKKQKLLPAAERILACAMASGGVGGGTVRLEPGAHLRPTAEGGPAVSMVVKNLTSATLTLMWSAFDGELLPYATIPAGGQHKQETFAQHVWLASDAATDTPLALFEAPVTSGTVVIHGAVLGPSRSEDEGAAAAAGRDGYTGGGGGGGGGRGGGGDNNSAAGERVLSPNKKWVAEVVDHNITIRAADGGGGGGGGGGGTRIVLSTDGTAKDGYSCTADRLVWSPDSTKIAAFKSRPEQQHSVSYIDVGLPHETTIGSLYPPQRRLDNMSRSMAQAHRFFSCLTPQPPLPKLTLPFYRGLGGWAGGDYRWSPEGTRPAVLVLVLVLALALVLSSPRSPACSTSSRATRSRSGCRGCSMLRPGPRCRSSRHRCTRTRGLSTGSGGLPTRPPLPLSASPQPNWPRPGLSTDLSYKQQIISAFLSRA